MIIYYSGCASVPSVDSKMESVQNMNLYYLLGRCLAENTRREDNCCVSCSILTTSSYKILTNERKKEALSNMKDNEEAQLAFLHGLIDHCGELSITDGVLECDIDVCHDAINTVHHVNILEELSSVLKVSQDGSNCDKSIIIDDTIGLRGPTAYNILGKINDLVSKYHYRECIIRRRKYYELIKWQHPAAQCSDIDTTCGVILKDAGAVMPTKAHHSDSGYDLTIIKKVKQLTPKTALYDTGVVVIPPHGTYTEIIPRSSLSKTGYMLANSVGIIDNSYRGTLMIALVKIDESMPDIELPFKCAQLIFRQCIDISLAALDIKDIDNTERGAGGFGSTDKKSN